MVITELDEFEPSFYICSKLRFDNILKPSPHYNDLYITVSDKVKEESHWDLSPWHKLTYTAKNGVVYDLAFEIDFDGLLRHKRLLHYVEELTRLEKEEKGKNKVKKSKVKKAKVKKAKVSTSRRSKVSKASDTNVDTIEAEIDIDCDTEVEIDIDGDTEVRPTVDDVTSVDSVSKSEIGVALEVQHIEPKSKEPELTDPASDEDPLLWEYEPRVVKPIIDIRQVIKNRGTQKTDDTHTLKQTIKRVMGIDIGMKNMAAITSNVFKPVLISGIPLYKILDTYANFFITPGYGRFSYKHRKSSQKRYLDRRNDKLEEYLILCVDKIMELINHNNIDCVVIGYPALWSNHKKFNIKNVEQMTQRILCRFKDMIKKRCLRHGINCVEIDEAYTSKCSFLDNEPIGKHKGYRGNRTDRDTYITKTGHQINADINASLNIIKKYLSSIGEWGTIYRYQLIGSVALSHHCSFNTEIGVNNIAQSKNTAQE